MKILHWSSLKINILFLSFCVTKDNLISLIKDFFSSELTIFHSMNLKISLNTNCNFLIFYFTARIFLIIIYKNIN